MKKVPIHFFCDIHSHINKEWSVLKEWYIVEDITTKFLVFY
jgi:hypothetical protein